MRRKSRLFHNLRKPKIRQTWNKINLYNLSRMSIPTSSDKTYFQQKWLAKSMTRAYHGEHIREKKWERMFRRTLPSVVPLDYKYLAQHNGSKLAAGRGSGVDAAPGQQMRITPKTPYMNMVYHPVERRLDTAIFRALFASSGRQARQLVTHGHVKVNGKKMIYPGYQLNPGDMFQVDVESVLFATGARKPHSAWEQRAAWKLRKARAEREEKGEHIPMERDPEYLRRKAAWEDAEYIRRKIAWEAALQGEREYLMGEWKCSSCGHHNPRRIGGSNCEKCKRDKGSNLAFRARRNGVFPPTRPKKADKGTGEEPNEAESEEQNDDDFPTDPKETLKHMLARAKGVLSVPTSNELAAKQKQDARALLYAVDRVLSRSHGTAPTGLTDSLEAQFLLLTQRLSIADPASSPASSPSSPLSSSSTTPPPTAHQPTGYKTHTQDRHLLHTALHLAASNPTDPSKPYRTPWAPRPYMSAFAFIPRYLEVNQNVCAAVYLRHPVARPGLAEVPTPFHGETNQLAFNWYLRRR